MSDPISFTRAIFIALLALFLVLRAVMTITEIQTAERSTNTVPDAFARKVSIEQHRRSVRYTAHVIQYEFLSALFAAMLCLVLTLAGGLARLTWLCDTLWGAGTAASFVVVALALLPALVFDGVVDWLKGDRLNLQYGYETGAVAERRRRHVVRSLVAGAVWLAALWWIVAAFELLGRAWWAACAALSVAGILWSQWLGPTVRILRNKHLVPMPDGPRSYRLRTLLANHGFPNAEVMLLPRPKGWRDGDAYLGRVNGRARFVLFEDTDAAVDEDALDAVTALAVAPVVQCHRRHRILFFGIVAVLVWEFLGWLLHSPRFYDALGVPAAVAWVDATPRSGVIAAMLLVVLPVPLYPLVFVLHGFTRLLSYAADRYALAHAGKDALIASIVELHRDNRNSLTPNPLYSLANHRRPHVTLRVRAVQQAHERR